MTGRIRSKIKISEYHHHHHQQQQQHAGTQRDVQVYSPIQVQVQVQVYRHTPPEFTVCSQYWYVVHRDAKLTHIFASAYHVPAKWI